MIDRDCLCQMLATFLPSRTDMKKPPIQAAYELLG